MYNAPAMQDSSSSIGIFLRCLEGVLTGIARELHSSAVPDSKGFAREAEGCYNLYTETLKQKLSASIGDVTDFIRYQGEKQRAFFESLGELCALAGKKGISLEILSPGEYLSPAYWDTGVVPGVSLRLSRRHILTAYPLTPAKTEYFQTLTQGPLAADLVWVTERYMLFLQQDQDPDGESKQNLEKLFGPLAFEDVNLKGFGPEIRPRGIRRSNIILALSEDVPEEKTLKRIMKKFGIPAVLVSEMEGFYTELYAGAENKMPAFLSEGR